MDLFNLLLKITIATQIQRFSKNGFDCALSALCSHGLIMWAAIAGVLIVLSIAILIAHALDLHFGRTELKPVAAGARLTRPASASACPMRLFPIGEHSLSPMVPTDFDITPRAYKDNALLQPAPRAVYTKLLSAGWTDALRSSTRTIRCTPSGAISETGGQGMRVSGWITSSSARRLLTV